MKILLMAVSLLCAGSVMAQSDTIVSKVYHLAALKTEKKETSVRTQILEGKGAVPEYLEIHTTTIGPGKAAHAAHKHDDEEMIIVKEGKIKVTIEGNSKVLGPGSVALAMPGDMHGFENAGTANATYYVLRYHTKSPDIARGKAAGGSFMTDWNDVPFNAHDKGGIRRFFEKPTAMWKRLEMHVTTLNAGLKSHDPHTHKAEEIVLMVGGDGEMQIGNSHQKCTAGDLVYLSSLVLHAIRNDGSKPTTYFAFQFE